MFSIKNSEKSILFDNYINKLHNNKNKNCLSNLCDYFYNIEFVNNINDYFYETIYAVNLNPESKQKWILVPQLFILNDNYNYYYHDIEFHNGSSFCDSDDLMDYCCLMDQCFRRINDEKYNNEYGNCIDHSKDIHFGFSIFNRFISSKIHKNIAKTINKTKYNDIEFKMFYVPILFDPDNKTVDTGIINSDNILMKASLFDKNTKIYMIEIDIKCFGTIDIENKYFLKTNNIYKIFDIFENPAQPVIDKYFSFNIEIPFTTHFNDLSKNCKEILILKYQNYHKKKNLNLFMMGTLNKSKNKSIILNLPNDILDMIIKIYSQTTLKMNISKYIVI
jgi:hypothetical protein